MQLELLSLPRFADILSRGVSTFIGPTANGSCGQLVG